MEEELWYSSMKAEYERLKEEKLFPDSIVEIFDNAVKELENLTLSEILQIKKIIEDNT